MRALNPPPVGFELGFARPARADAAAQLRHGLALAREPRQHVLELRPLHLQLALAGPRVACKNVQDQLRPVQHTAGKRRFKIAQLRRRKIVVEEHQVGLDRSRNPRNLLHLARADQRGRVQLRPPLHYLRGHHSARARHQLTKLGQRLVRIQRGKALHKQRARNARALDGI